MNTEQTSENILCTSSTLFAKMLSIRVLECGVAQDGVEIYGRRKFVYNQSSNEALSVLLSYFNKSILKSLPLALLFCPLLKTFRVILRDKCQ